MSKRLIPKSQINNKFTWGLFTNKNWLIFTILILIACGISIRLGIWQYQRHESRILYNQSLTQALEQEPIALNQIDNQASPWQKVFIEGSFDTQSQQLVRRKYFEGKLGFWVVAKFVTQDNRIVLVNRGFVPVSAAASVTPDITAPNGSTFMLEGFIQPLEPESEKASDIPLGQASAINREQFAITEDDYQYFIHQSNNEVLSAIKPPEISSGPHLAYSLQWFAFAVMIVIGWITITRKDLIDQNQEKN